MPPGPPTRVLFVVPDLSGGGAERVVVTLLRHLDRQRFEPHLALVVAEGPYLKDVPQDVPVHDLAARRARYALFRLARLAWKLKPKVIMSTIHYLNLLLIPLKWLLPRGTKLIVREATIVSAALSEKGARNARLYRRLYPIVYPHADLVICQSKDMLDDLGLNFGVPADRLRLLSNPVDVDRISKLAAEGPNPFAKTGGNFISVGRLVYAKGFDLLLEAMSIVVQHFSAAQLWILGQGPLEAELKSQAESLGLSSNVHFLGFQSNPYTWMQHANAVVQASRSEGFPNALLEACSVGTPVIALDCPGGTREIFNSPGVGIIAPAGVANLALAIEDFLSNRTKLLAPEERRQQMATRFRAERITSEYERVFQDVATSG